MSKNQLIATTIPGIENVLEGEIQKNGMVVTKKKGGAVWFKGGLKELYSSNLKFKTALKILKPLHIGKITDDKQLYKVANKIEWERYFNYDQTFSIEVTGKNSFFKNNNYVALVFKDGVVDRFKKIFQQRPDIDKKNGDISIHIYMSEMYSVISLNSSGESLNRRGYREIGGKAPINEVLAASMVKFSKWKGKKNLIDPMCGSGTILIEAVQILNNSINDKEFLFKNWKDFDQKMFDKIKDGITQNSLIKNNPIGIEKNYKMSEIAKGNIKKGGVENYIEIINDDMFNYTPPKGRGIVISNPPYGKRVGDVETLGKFYQKLSNFWQERYSGYDIWIVTEEQYLDYIDITPKKLIKTVNGGIDVVIAHFPIF